ncbi:hypothetical protein NW762_009360 [Fusarium torreyae]|uniref:Uncharacterized protein n=1 Tax=Fusarium torreyae TaxID=1237075 RepID=A0A9W8VEQ6_9HYPO|nr:hypothetical protein NW762_009360 [Fusarium torreyae]
MTEQHPLRLFQDIKDAVHRYDSNFNTIKSPHTAYEQKTTAIRTRITQIWSSLATTPADQIPKLQEDVIELGGQLKELEIDHKANIRKYERDYHQKLRETAEAFRTHVLEIMGPPNIQSHTPAVSTAVSNDQPLENDSNDFVIPSPLPDLSPQNQRILPSPASPLGDSITVGTSPSKRAKKSVPGDALAAGKKRKADLSLSTKSKRRRGEQEEEGRRGDQDENMNDYPSNRNVSVASSRSTRRHTRNHPRVNNEANDEEFEGITNPQPGKIYLAFWEMSQEWFAVLVLPMQDLETVGVPGSIDSLGLAEHLPSCYRHNKTKGTYSWAKRYQDGQPMVLDRMFPVIYFDGRDFPARSALGWISARDLRKFDPKARNGHIPHIRAIRKYLRAHPPRASTAPEQEEHRRREVFDDEDGEYREDDEEDDDEEEEEEEGEEEEYEEEERGGDEGDDDDYDEDMVEEETDEMESETTRTADKQPNTPNMPSQRAARPSIERSQAHNTEPLESAENQIELEPPNGMSTPFRVCKETDLYRVEPQAPQPPASNHNQEAAQPLARPQPSSPLFLQNTSSPQHPPSSRPATSTHRRPSPPRPTSTSNKSRKLPGPMDDEAESKPRVPVDVISIPDSDDEDEANTNQASTFGQQPRLHGIPITSDHFFEEPSNPAQQGQYHQNGESSTNPHAVTARSQGRSAESPNAVATRLARAAFAHLGQHDSHMPPSQSMGNHAHQPSNETTFSTQNPQHRDDFPHDNSATQTGQGHLSVREAEYYAGSRRRMENPNSTREPVLKAEPQARNPPENPPSAPASIASTPNLVSLPSITSMMRTSPAPQAPLRPSSSDQVWQPAQMQSPGQVQQFSGQVLSPVQSPGHPQFSGPVQHYPQVQSPGQVYSDQMQPPGQAQGFFQAQHASQVHNSAISHPPHPPQGLVLGSNYQAQGVVNAPAHAPGTSHVQQPNIQSPRVQPTVPQTQPRAIQAQNYQNSSQPSLQGPIRTVFRPIVSPQDQSSPRHNQPTTTLSQPMTTHHHTAPPIAPSQSSSTQPTPPPNADPLFNAPEGFWPRALDSDLVEYLKQYQEQANLQRGLLGLRIRSGHYVCPFCPDDKRKLYAQSGGVVNHLKRHWGAFKTAQIAQAAQAVQVAEAARQGQT